MKHFLLLALGLVLTPSSPLGAALPASTTAPGTTVLSGSDNSYNPMLTPDGRFALFTSMARDLVTNDDTGVSLDLFLRDLATRQTTLVSVNLTGHGGGNGNAGFAGLSANGRYVVFESAAGNLVAFDTNGAVDIFLRELGTGITTPVNVSTNGILEGRSGATEPQITPDGRWVAFVSASPSLVPGDTNGIKDVFLRDLANGTTRLVSLGALGGIPLPLGGTSQPGFTGASSSPSLTPDGRWVAFVSTATNLVAGVTNTAGEIYLRDMLSGTLVHVSTAVSTFLPPTPRPPRAFNPVISADGSRVAYKAVTPGSSAGVLLSYDVAGATLTLVSSNINTTSWPEISANGRYIAHENGTQVYRWDQFTGSNVLVSVNQSGSSAGNGISHTPVLTPDGSKVAFLSKATDLTPAAANGRSQVFLRDLDAAITRLVSATPSGGTSAGEIDATLPALSADGRVIAFESEASDLTPGDFNLAADVFLRDLETNAVELVSSRHDSLVLETGAGFASVIPNSVSADGSVVAFIGRDTNLLPDDTNTVPDGFVRNLTTGSIHWLRPLPSSPATLGDGQPQPAVSANGRYVAFVQKENYVQLFVWRLDVLNGTFARASVAGAPPYSALQGTAPSISADGRLVVFQSFEPTTQFASSIGNFSSTNIILRDLTFGTNQVLSVNLAGTGSGNGPSTEPTFSPDGRWVLFVSTANNLVTNSVPLGERNLYARDLLMRRTLLVGMYYRDGAVFSADSRYVAWRNPNLAGYRTDLTTGVKVSICADCTSLSLSDDGHLLAYGLAPSLPGIHNIFVKDLVTGVTNAASVPRLGSAANGHSTQATISADGRYVVFASKASNLVENDGNNGTDVFVRDRLLGTTLLVSANAAGTASGNLPSSVPLLSADGRTVVFQSHANDLIPGDFNERRDVYVLRWGGADSDGDGLDDDWEMVYFSNLASNGTGDADQDGQSDQQEFLAGTNPTLDTSLLRALTVVPLLGGNKTLLWSAVAGRTYRVQFKNAVTEPQWSNLPGDVTATTSTASAIDNTAGAQPDRYYRVTRLP